MLSKVIKLAGALAMTLALALGAGALAGPEGATHTVAQGEGPGHPAQH
ncbi:hypothetical protein ACWDBD_06040 [Streptomyces sp. NPDC001118]